jgi:hypothetical protein
MTDNFEKTTEQAAAFQKMWLETMTKMMQTAFTMSPESAPPDVLRQIRSGIFQALAKSWEEFMRSPQFLDGMRQWMQNAIAFRKMTNDFLAKFRTDLQAPSREDIDSVMLSVRHMEKRLLDRVEELAGQIHDLNLRLGNGAPAKTAKKTSRAERPNATKRRAATRSRKVSPTNPETKLP